MRDLYTRSPDIPGPLRSSHYKISSKDLDQDPTRRKYREGCADEIKIGTALERERSDTYELRRGLHEPKQKMPQAERQRHSISKMHGATARAIRQAQSPERVAFANIKSAPRYSESDPTRTNSAEGCTSRHKKCPRLSASDIPSAK